MANKVKYGLKNVYYAVATINDTNHSATYGKPVAFPGAVSISLDPEGELTPFRADNIDYWVGNSNNGYSGDLEMAMITDSFRKDVLGYGEDSNGVLLENKDTEAVHFALMFQFEGDVKATRHVMYNCTATRPSASGETTGETIEPQTETTTITASSIFNAALEKEIVRAKTGENTNDATYDGWFTAVYQATSESE